MSIDLVNPETVLGKVDAAANYVAQIRLATMVGDKERVMFAIGEAERLLSTSMEQIEEEEGDSETQKTPVVTQEYIGEELALFWESPYGAGKEKIATFWWPLHPPDKTAEVESAFESIAKRAT